MTDHYNNLYFTCLWRTCIERNASVHSKKWAIAVLSDLEGPAKTRTGVRACLRTGQGVLVKCEFAECGKRSSLKGVSTEAYESCCVQVSKTRILFCVHTFSLEIDNHCSWELVVYFIEGANLVELRHATNWLLWRKPITNQPQPFRHNCQ